MSSLGDAVNAIKSIILIEERIKVQGAKLDRLSDAVTDVDRRLVRLEATLDIVSRRATSTSLPLAISDQSGS